MLTLSETTISTQYHQLSPGGDLAAIVGLCKALIAADDDAKRAHQSERVLDVDFIREHTSGYEEFENAVRSFEWSDIENCTGLRRQEIEAAAHVYAHSNAVIACYGMGLTQHRSGVLAIQMLSNLLLMRGNIGKPGAGIFPVRGHSNVQGQRTVGITEKPELAPLDRLAAQYKFEPPRIKGLDTVAACRGILDETVKGLYRARRQFPARGARNGGDGKSVAQTATDGANPHQTQSWRGHSRTRWICVALPGPN